MRPAFFYILIGLFFVAISAIKSQNTDALGSNTLAIPIVITQQGGTLINAWAGGLNNCQFGEINLNNDAIKDLVVFDRHGNKIIPFINKGISDSVSYEYAPEYISKFPKISNWVQFIDYNADDKVDIFTYGYGAIKVYKNTSSSSNGLSFELVTSSLNSIQNNSQINLYVSDVDYPAIVDIDNDGDLDILTFFGLGSFVDLHKNLSIENYGNSDTLLFKLEKRGWGDFMEGVESNIIQLDTIFPIKTKHSGSTFLITDLNNDNIKDILLGDIGYHTVMALYNNQSKITSVDSLLINPVELPIFPVFAQIDINNDTKKELIVSSFDPSTSFKKNEVSTLSINTTTSPFQLSILENHFLQNTMIDLGSGAYPLLLDWDNDGLQDLFISNGCEADLINCKSSIYFYKNIGTKSKAVFKLITDDFESISLLNKTFLFPASADLDNDLDLDMIIGNSDGTLDYFKNNNGQLILSQTKLNNIDVGDYSTPFLYDINADSKPDIFIGNKDGTIAFYINNSVGNTIQFDLITSQLNNINVTDTNTSWYGYSTPAIFQYKNNLVLAIGSEMGLTFFYTIRYENGIIQTSFISNTILPNVGLRSSITSAELNNDNYNDFILGNFSGGCNFVAGSETLGIKDVESTQKLILNFYPNPVKSLLHIRIGTQTHGFIKLNTIDGRTVYSKQITNLNFDIDCSQFENGFYIIELIVFENGQTFTNTNKLVLMK